MDYMPNYSDYGTCHRCGVGIKYKFYYGGNTYGSTCIERMLGIKVERFNTTDVDAIVRQIEEDKRTMEQKLQDEKDLYLPVINRVLGSKNIGAVGYKIDVDVLITDCFWFEGMYGSSCCIKMVDAKYNQFIALQLPNGLMMLRLVIILKLLELLKSIKKCQCIKLKPLMMSLMR